MNWQIARVAGRERGRLTLEFSPTANCRRCQRGDGCGAGVFAGLFRRASTRLVLVARDGVAAGDWVRVGLSGRALALAALVHYGLPLAAFLAGAASAHGLASGTGGRDLAALAGGLGGFAVCLLALRFRPILAVNPVIERLSCIDDDSNSSGRPFA